MPPGGPPKPDHPAFDMLDRRILRQLYAMKWPALRPLQSDAIRAYLGGTDHLMLMAQTAAGKTEAAFLPVLSAIADEPRGSVRALYIGPLKALINDQFERIQTLCTHLDMPVHRWHGDVGAASKDKLVAEPGGVLLITPESLESLLVNRTAHLRGMLGGLRAVVIDELHAFLTGERGLHLASLLNRIDRYRDPMQPRPRRLGLSATIGDRSIGQRYLDPDQPERVAVIRHAGETTETRLRVHGYDGHRLAPPAGPETNNDNDNPPEQRVDEAIARDLVSHCQRSTNLIFANAKGDIEVIADAANEHCASLAAAPMFLVHHGSLSNEAREDTEARMKSSRPTTALCSSTLEMGIDIGAVRLVGQIGAPWSVASLTQRLGRSGRQPGEHRRLRCYADCTVDPEATHPARQLPLELLQTVAACELMLEGWVEPPAEHGLDLSTLTHQIIGTIAELGAITAQDLHATLCTKGPFRAVGTDLFARLLRSLGEQDIIEQDPQGPLILGLLGEKLRAARDYYAAFSTRTEFSVIAGRTTLGTLPVERLPQTNDRFVFAARRWRVTLVETERREIHVAPAGQSKRPLFASSGGPVHHQLVDRMRTVLADRTTIAYLDDAAAKSLAHARDLARDLDLARRGTTELSAAKSLWLTWTGTAETTTAEAMLASVGIQARAETIGLICDCPLSDLDAAIGHFSSHEPDLLTLAEHVEPKQRRKYDEHLSEELLTEAIASTLVWKTP